MATTASVTSAVSEPVILFSSGPFGLRVAGMLYASLPACRMDDDVEIGDCFRVGGSAVVAAMWRAAPTLTSNADELSFELKIPWLPIILAHPLLRVGPLVFPGEGPCFRCYSMRCAQHDPHIEDTTAIEAFYSVNMDAGPSGYLPQHARMAAAVAIRMLAPVITPDIGGAFPIPPGQAASISLTKNTIAINRVVACHNCDRCRTREVPGLKRSGRRKARWPQDPQAENALSTELRF
jgi:bacteriocin biosynthesis cyclodehydratase domain-containing protein